MSGSQALSLQRHHHHRPRNNEKVELGSSEGISAEEFANAAVQARIEADQDIRQEIKNHKKISSAAHNKAWKKHFKDT